MQVTAGCSEAQSLSMGLYRYLKPMDGILPSPNAVLKIVFESVHQKHLDKKIFDQD